MGMPHLKIKNCNTQALKQMLDNYLIN